MTFARLLAKSTRNPIDPRAHETLPGHTSAVLDAAEVTLEEVGDGILAAFGLDPTRWRVLLRRAVLGACTIHDLGKTSAHFQHIVRQNGRVHRQAWTHEFVGLLLMDRYPHLTDWISGGDTLLANVIRTAVVGHHLRFEGLAALHPRDGSGSLRFPVHCDHADAVDAFSRGATRLGISSPPALPAFSIDLIDADESDATLQRAGRGLVEWSAALPDDGSRTFAALVRDLLICADACGSALPRQGKSVGEWVRNAIRRTCTSGDLDHLVQTRLGQRQPRAFQNAVASVQSRTAIVRAGCGTGKTVAAYMWARERASGRKLFVCYPTMGTATQGFVDYVPHEGVEAQLVHSHALADLLDIATTGEGESAVDADAIDAAHRLDAIRLLSAPLTICTADAVLGVIQNNRRAAFGFPAFARAAFVFDEVHQYDARLFGALLRFIEATPDSPKLLMTATLSDARRVAIEKAAGSRVDLIAGPPDVENALRYCIRRVEVPYAWEKCREVLASGRRVLWVSNTVERAIGVGAAARRGGIAAEIYHSRFLYRDRRTRHARVVTGFKGDAALLAATTQVCEVSLDISADLLITELAPAAALIQRLGRLNRRFPPSVPQGANCLVIPAVCPEPYGAGDVEEGSGWVDDVANRVTSQAGLAEAFDRLPRREVFGHVESAWLDVLPFARIDPLRDSTGTVPVVREEELSGLGQDPTVAEIADLTLPMPVPRGKDWRAWRRVAGAFVAPKGTIFYDPDSGGRWISAA